jgi:FG-GAP-like repeat
MKKFLVNKFFLMPCLALLAIFGVIHSTGIGINKVSANNTPQTLPFTQDWTNTGLITTNDDWTMVPGIIGYLGDIGTTTQAAIDPRTITQDFATQDVIANQANPDTQTSGGVAEFEITNPTVALQGSGTADAANIVIYLNTTGQSNIRVAFNARDVDGSADDTAQPLAVQYRVGTTGNFSNVPGPGAYFPDVTTGASATQVTPVAVTLPPTANNQANVQVRILTTNSPGSDEWVGIDDINITANGPANAARANVDFDGDGRSDYSVTRDTSTPFNEAAAGINPRYWYNSASGSGATSVTQWGLQGDTRTPADFDGDGKTDIAIWRSGALANFYILQSSNNTARVEQFGQIGDDPRVVGDYNGDGNADLSVYRSSLIQGTWFYRTTPGGAVNYVPWGGTNAIALPGDYDGDGKWDFNVRTDSGGALFALLKSNGGGIEWTQWGLTSDTFVPGDFDGDGKFDYCAVRNASGTLNWYILERDGGGTGGTPIAYGTSSDVPAAGDYDGDTRQDIAVWRANADPTLNFFFVRNALGGQSTFEWGQQGDTPTASWYNH